MTTPITARSLVLLVLISPLAHAEPTFRGLGEPLGATSSVPEAVSDDGSVVIGYASGRPTRWTAATGNRFMPLLPGASSAMATDLSADGSIIVGRSDHGMDGYRACRWTSEGTAVDDLSDTPGRVTVAWANAVSADGSTVVGQGYEEWQGSRAVRVTDPAPPISLGILAPVQGSSEAIDISADGSVIAGWSHASSYAEAFRWTESTGMVSLGPSPIPFTSYAWTRAISADGSAIVGYLIAERNTAFRWTAATGIEPLQPPTGHTYSYAFAVKGDGSVVGGQLSGGLGDPVRAALWDTTHGWRYLEDVLIAAGIGSQLDGWELETVMAMSPDGRYIAGVGRYLGQRPRAWLADIGAPCAADLNQDGVVDFADYLEFLNLFETANPRVDFTADGTVDFADYLEFLNLYDAGC